MKRITRDNYEAYLLDLSEGRLNARDQAALQSFLNNNPDLASPPADLFLPTLKASPSSFVHKNLLKHSDFEEDEKVIAYLEGDLDIQSEKAFEQDLKTSPSLNNALVEFRKAYLQPDFAIVYPEKEKLKKGGVVRPLLWTSISVAASICLFLLFFPQSNAPSPSAMKDTGKPAEKLSPLIAQTKDIALQPAFKEKVVSKRPAPIRAEEPSLEQRDSLTKILPKEITPSVPLVQATLTIAKPVEHTPLMVTTNKPKNVLTSLFQRIAAKKSEQVKQIAQQGIQEFTALTKSLSIYQRTSSGDTSYTRINFGYFTYTKVKVKSSL